MVKIERLEKSHIREQFKCEEDSPTEYLKTQVSQDVKKKLAVCFVTVNESKHVLGYYTLSTESIGRESIPLKYLNKVPRNYNVPVILLGRLARDISVKGTRIGEILLLDALFRSYTLSEQSIGAMAIVTDPINQLAEQFYKKYGFEQLGDSKKLFLPMNVIKHLI